MSALRHALVGLAWVAAGVIALVASAVYHAQMPIAHRIVRDAVNAFVTGEIRGELAIGRLDTVTLDHIVARHVSLYDAHGRRVIAADRVDLYPDFSALRGNTLRFKVARLTHGHVRMVDEGEGTPSWIAALNPKIEGPPSADPLRALLDRIELSDVSVYGEYLGLTDFRVEQVNAHGRLEIHRNVQVRIDGATGTFVRPFPYEGLIDDIRGTIDTDPLQGVDLHIKARRERIEVPQSTLADGGGLSSPDDERVDARVQYKSLAPFTPQELRISLKTDAVTPDSLRGLGYTWIGPIEAPLRGHVELFGPTEQLSIEAEVESRAGDARASGTISEVHGVSVHIMTDRLEADELIASAPALTLRGSLHVSTSPDETEPPRVRVTLASMRYKGLVIPAFELTGVLQEDRLFIERARSTQGGRLSLRGTVGFDGGTDLRVEANLPALHREPNVAQYVENLEGALQADVRIRIPPRGRVFDVDGKIELVDARYASIAASRVTIAGSARGDPQLPQVNVQVRGEDVHVLGYPLGVASFALRGGPHAYVAQGEFSPSKEQKTFYFDASIAATRRQFVIQADPIEFVVGDKTFRGAARDLTIVHGQSVSLGLLRLASGSERLEASGMLRLRGEDTLRADLQNFDLAALHALLGDRFPLQQGHADATVELRGDVARPELLLQGAMRGGQILDVPNVDAMYFVTYKDGLLELDNQIEVAGRGALHLRGQGKLDRDIADPVRALETGHYDLELSSTDFDLLLLPQLREQLHQGKVSGTAKISGSLDAVTLHGDASIAGLCFPGTRPVDVRGDFDYDGAHANLNLQLSDAAGPLGTLDAETDVPWKRVRDAPREAAREVASGRWKLTGRTQARALERLPFDLPSSLRWPFEVNSRFAFEHAPGATRGSMILGAKGLRQLQDETCRLTASSSLSAVLKLQNDSISATLSGLLDGKKVWTGEARIAVPVESWLDGKSPLRITRADLQGNAAFDDIERVPVLCQHGHGDLHADVRFDALFTPEQRAQVDLYGSLNPHVRVLEGRQRRVVESCLDDPARVWMQVKLDGKKASALGWLEGCYGGHTDLAVSVPLAWQNGLPGVDGARDTRVEIDFGESQLRPLLDRVPGVLGFGAIANGRLTIVGNKQRVAYSGQVALSEGKLYLLSTGQELKELQTTLSGNGNWVKVDGLRARTGSGTIEAAGGIGFDRWKPSRAQLGVVLRNLPVQREGIELASLNGSAALTTEIGPERAQTAVKLHTLAILLPGTSSRSLQSLEPHPDVLVTTDKPKAVEDKPYVFEFVIDGRRGLSAKRNDFDVALATELALQYADPDLYVGGYVEFRRGTFEVFGKEFEINRGSLQFDGGNELNPEVNLTATQRPEAGAQEGVIARVSGTLAQPVVEFYSETCPGQGAIVQLVSGRCPSESDSTLQDATGTQDAFALGIVGGILTLGARRQLGGLIPRISVESTGQGAQTRLKAGFEAVPKFMRPLVQRVYVQGALSTQEDSQGTGATTDGATPDFLIELYFPYNIVGSGRVAPTTRSWGLDVTWEP